MSYIHIVLFVSMLLLSVISFLQYSLHEWLFAKLMSLLPLGTKTS